ncbi:MAG: alpha/beta hydrolase fold domain-containing protein [Bacteroidaceae bacterium]|nr:alpha/beta hydrolase fold domain-containing protein [Bacteroidaceae bacterium]
MKNKILFLLGMALLMCVPVQGQDKVWKKGDALITDASQIKATAPESDQFAAANLIRPESDGVGTNQYIYHTAWSGSNMITADVDPFLQFHLPKAEQHIIFSMIGSAWSATYDTPTEVVIQATNNPSGEWTTITTLKNMDDDFTSYTPERYTSPHIDLGAKYTDVKFLVKKTYVNRHQSAGGLLLSLGRFQIYEAYLGEPDPEPQGPSWKKDVALLTNGSQITSNNSENGFPPSNLLRPESEGVGTNQIIWHSSWSNPGPLPAGTDTYLQVHLNEAEQHIIFTMIGSTWTQTYDTPVEMVIEAANLPGEWTEVAHLTDMQNDFTGWTPDRYQSPHIDLGAAYTDIRFIVKKTVNAGKSNRYDANGNPFVSLGRFQVYRAVEGKEEPVDPKENINLLFIGNSITAGATLGNASTQAPPIVCRALVEEATGVTTNVYNGGHSGITTFGYLPGRDDFTRIVNNAKAFRKQNGGNIYISIMLGTNDSACSGTEGAPVNPDVYGKNIRSIIDKLFETVPDCKILLNYPIWYSPSTYNGAMYLQEGLDRLRSYYPVLDAIVAEYDQVYAGKRDVWEYFENNFALFTRESGNAGYFYLHPNVNGAKRLAEIWANSLLELIKADGIEVKNPLPEWNVFKPQNDKKYSMKTTRGDMGVKDGKLTSTVKTGIGATKGEFAFITYEGNTYLYSVADKSFMYRDPISYSSDWSNIICSNEYLQPIKVNFTGTPEAYPYYLTMDGYVFNSASSTETGICANTYTPHDAGNQTAIQEEGDFDPTEALEIISNYVAKQPVVFEAQLPTGASLTVFRTEEENNNGKSVIIIPGGGYSYVAGSYEGSDWAPFYRDLGFTVAVLRYNLPGGNPEIPLNDGKAALQYLRENAEDLQIDPKQVGVMGFSAGGHLASTIATHLTGDELPAFQVLYYPVISMESSYTHAGSRENLLGKNPSKDLVNLYSNEKQVTSETPPAYICWASDDATVKPTNSLKYRQALKNAGVPVTSKTFSSGGHGFGFKTTFAHHKQMLQDLTKWLEGLDETYDGIKTPSDSPLMGRGEVYDLSGRKINSSLFTLHSSLKKGIVITDNKKMIIR